MHLQDFVDLIRPHVPDQAVLNQFRTGQVNDLDLRFSINAELARKLRSEGHYENQRRVVRNYVGDLAEEMIQDRFRPDVTSIIFGVIGDEVSVVGGNQRLTALVTADETKPGISFVMKTQIKRFANASDARDFYGLTHEALPASQGAKANVYITNRPEGMTDSEVATACTAVREIIVDDIDPMITGYLRTGYEKTRDFYTLANDYMPVANEVLNFIKSFPEIDVFGGRNTTADFARALRVAPRLALFIVLFKYPDTGAKAKRLLTKVMTGDFAKHDLAWHVAVDLVDQKQKGTGGQNHRTLTFKLMASIWNTFYKTPNAMPTRFLYERTTIQKIAGIPGTRIKGDPELGKRRRPQSKLRNLAGSVISDINRKIERMNQPYTDAAD